MDSKGSENRRKRRLEVLASWGIKPGDIVYSEGSFGGKNNEFNWHICYDDGEEYSPDTRDLGANNCGMFDPDHDSFENYGHISQCYKSLPLGQNGNKIFGADDWEYYFGCRAWKDPEFDPYSLRYQTPEELAERLKLNNFPEGWQLPEEDKE